MKVSTHVRHSMNLQLFFLSALNLKDMLCCKNIQRLLCRTFFGFSLVLKMLKFEILQNKLFVL